MFYQGVCGEFGWVRFPVICFLYKTNPNPRKSYLLWGKSDLNATFNLIFLVLGWPLGWGVRRFHNNIYMFPNQTDFDLVNRKHPTAVDRKHPTAVDHKHPTAVDHAG